MTRENITRENANDPGGIAPMICREIAGRLYARAGAGRWGLTPEAFARTLARSAARRFAHAAGPKRAELERYLESLCLEDLALASACSEGIETAWREFMGRYREVLYSGARAIVGPRGEAAARELADSLYAELYGVGRGSGTRASAERRPLLDYYHGRSRLSTWLRAVLAQRYVDRLRETARLVPAEEDDSALTVVSQAANREPDGERVAYGKLIHEACESALAELAPRDRLALSLYYVKEKTLAEIGRIIGEHEATVSRRLDRVRCFLRENTEERLRAQGLGEAQVELCFECALQDGPLDLSRILDEETGAGAPPPTLPPKKPAPGNAASAMVAKPLNE
jgi:RNA polymerase sigma factor (sigma-70 family)